MAYAKDYQVLRNLFKKYEQSCMEVHALLQEIRQAKDQALNQAEDQVFTEVYPDNNLNYVLTPAIYSLTFILVIIGLGLYCLKLWTSGDMPSNKGPSDSG